MTAVKKLPASRGELDAVDAVTLAVDAKGRAMDDKWGIGRLPMLVPAEWAAKLALQRRKFSEAIQAWDYPSALKHGQAMERAYDVLDRMATEAGHHAAPPEQWEFETEAGLVILVKNRRQTNLVERHGRAAQVWSLDEVASVVTLHPTIVATKTRFPGARVVDVRPKVVRDDDVSDLPF